MFKQVSMIQVGNKKAKYATIGSKTTISTFLYNSADHISLSFSVFLHLSLVSFSVLITDAGHCITFGGGNTSYSQHPPHLFTLNNPTPSSTPTNQPPMSGMERTDAIENALNQPYRIKKLTFGLGHAIALVDKKE